MYIYMFDSLPSTLSWSSTPSTYNNNANNNGIGRRESSEMATLKLTKNNEIKVYTYVCVSVYASTRVARVLLHKY